MPDPQQIVRGLSSIANDAVWLSRFWHVVAAVTIAAFVWGYRPNRRSAATSLSIPLASVSIVALAYDNYFNGAVFAALSGVLAGLARGASTQQVRWGSPWAVVLGSILVAFGWVYPHFLEGVSWFAYLYSAPLGTIPCPTLSAVVGVALLADGFGVGAAAWRLVLACAALFYSVFGMLRLGVAIDSVLLLGGVGLMAQHVQHRRRRLRGLQAVAGG